MGDPDATQHLADAYDAVPAQDHAATVEGMPSEEGPAAAPTQGTAMDLPGRRRGLVYLALCLAFALALVVPNLLSTSSSASPGSCGEGAMIAQALAVPARPSAPAYLLAVVRPQALPNVAPGNEPGCQVLYRSADDGLTWTVSFSATAEAPASVATGPSGSTYLLTQRLSFPLSVVGNVYRSDAQAGAWTWARVSPQGRHDVPMVSATDMVVSGDGSLILREGNGDGAALIRSSDGGDTWRPVVIPQLLSVGSVATLGSVLAVSTPLLEAGSAPGMISGDDGVTWQSMGLLSGVPARTDLRPILSANTAMHALILDLVPATQVGPGGTVARYASLDGGRHWQRVSCTTQPGPGCAVAARWAAAGSDRYVLYRRQLYWSHAGGRWQVLTARLPAPSGTILQVLAIPEQGAPALYIVGPQGIWRWEGDTWRSIAAGLGLAPANAVET